MTGHGAPIGIDGKFLRIGGERRMLALVTYGPFPGGWPGELMSDFRRIRSTGFDGVRLFELPTAELLEAARSAGLVVFAGLRWPCATDFLAGSAVLASARVALADGLRRWGGHPALAGAFVANEVPPDIARWLGPARVREAIEGLIRLGRELCPERLFVYGNFPSTEYLEPGNADFTAMNVYLEDESAFRRYLRRLHHIAGDRPLVISEFGLDSRRHGPDRQAETLRWAVQAARDNGLAGFTVYAWSDCWWNAGAEVLDWDFGLVDRQGNDKPALHAVAAGLHEARCGTRDPRRVPRSPQGEEGSASHDPPSPRISVIICTRNGAQRIASCLAAVDHLDHPDFETIVADDGSDDSTAGIVATRCPQARLIRLAPCGLSAARNAAAAAARGAILAFTDDDCRPDREWLLRLEETFAEGDWDAVGGPNLPPPPATVAEAVVAAAPGAPSHVLLDDLEAEHVPGCNLAVRRAAFARIGGFDPRFHTAGDDVDFCWRLRDAGLRIGFSPTAFVWHDRRADAFGFLCQQAGYGHAEALLADKFPQRFARRGGARWLGRIYEGGPIRAGRDAVIYHGLLGTAGYQAVVDRMLPRRPIDDRFDGPFAQAWLAILERLQPLVRGTARRWFRRTPGTAPTDRGSQPPAEPAAESIDELSLWSPEGRTRSHLLDALLGAGWQPADARSGWDLTRAGCRLLAATELADGPGRLTRVRLAGPARQVAAAVTEVRAIGTPASRR